LVREEQRIDRKDSSFYFMSLIANAPYKGKAGREKCGVKAVDA